jgi:hypothetical protein
MWFHSWHVYNDDNKEKVKHDEEDDRIRKEVEQDKRQQDVRNSRLELLRKRKAETSSRKHSEPYSGKTLDKKHSYDQTIQLERYSLFPEALLREAKITEAQKEVKDRESWVKPVGFSDVRSKDIPWYSKSKETLSKDGVRHNPGVSKSTSQSGSQSIEQLRKKRLARERLEREKASNLFGK